MINPIIVWQLGRPQHGVRPTRAGRRRARRRRATGDAGLTEALAGPPRDFAVACQAALEDLERRRDGFDAERALRGIAIALGELAGSTVVVTTRTNRAAAICDAPNCAGHRTQA